MATWFLRGIPKFRQMQLVVQQGQLVTIEVIQIMDKRFGQRGSLDVDFRYNGRQQSVSVDYKFFEKVKGQQTAQLLHLPEYPDLFLSPTYDVEGQARSNLIVSGMMVLSAGYFLFMAFKYT